MKIAQSIVTLGMILLASGCANRRGEQPSPPAASPGAEVSAPAREAVPAPAPAAKPVGLDPGAQDDQLTRDEAGEEEFATLEAAEHALHQAQADLNRLALAEPAKGIGSSSGDNNNNNNNRAASKATQRGAPAPALASEAAGAVSSGRCENACKAFASLTRAANAVCRLDGAQGAHCAKAKQVVAEATTRVSACNCPVIGQ